MMKRLPLLKTLLVSVPVLAITGCVSWTSEGDEETQTLPALSGTVWQVEDIDNGGIIDNSMITVAFSNEQVTGSTGCNRYFGTYETVGSSITVRGLGSTLRACAPAIAQQEERFLQALRSATSFRMESDTWLLIIDDKEIQRLKMIEIDEDPTATDTSSAQPQGTSPAKPVAGFSCEQVGQVGIRFVGPETLDVTMGEQSEVLQRVPSASGTHYVGDTLEFRNKGPSGILTVDGTDYPCTRND